MAIKVAINNNKYQLGDTASFDVTGTNITIAAWIKLDQSSAARSICGKWNTGTVSQRQYIVQIDTGSLVQWNTGTGAGNAGLGSTTRLRAGIWYHVVCMMDGTAKYIVINGWLDAKNANFTTMPNTTQELHIGSRNDAAEPLLGIMHDFAIWSTTLTINECRALYSRRQTPNQIKAKQLGLYIPFVGAVVEPDYSFNSATVTGTHYVTTPSQAPSFKRLSVFKKVVLTNRIITAIFSATGTSSANLVAAKVFTTALTAIGTGVGSLLRGPIRVLRATGVSAPTIKRDVLRRLAVNSTANATLTITKVLHRTLSTSASVVSNLIANAHRCRVAATGFLSQKWSALFNRTYSGSLGDNLYSGSLTNSWSASMRNVYTGTLEGPVVC